MRETDGSAEEEENYVWLLGINVSLKPRWAQLIICGGGFFFGYMVNGICELSYGWYFTFVEGLVYFGVISCYGFRAKHILNPWRTYCKLSAVLMGSHGLTKGSLIMEGWMFRSCCRMLRMNFGVTTLCVLPVMVMGAFIPGFRQKYSFHEYVSAIMFVVGLVIFTLADAQASPDFSILGVVMVVAALVLDAFVGNFQEVIFLRNPATTQMEMLFWSTVVGLPLLIPPMWQHPYVYLVLIFEACATFVGQLFVLCLIALFGAATTAMVTTAWKAMTLLLSYIIFTKPLSEQHYTSLILLVMGFVLKMMADQSDSKHSSHHKATSLQLETPK
ncbi:hypothetical protein CY35_05G113800, partial [Sphagnum magellanicum]